MTPEEAAEKFSVVLDEGSPFYGMLTYNSSEGIVPGKVKLALRPSASDRPRMKYTFGVRLGDIAVRIDNDHRMEMQ
jgi:hypothetical protein